jgi:hypothetical protein
VNIIPVKNFVCAGGIVGAHGVTIIHFYGRARNLAKNIRGKSKSGKRRGGPPGAIAVHVPTLTRKALGKRGLAEANLLTDWPTIIGTEQAQICQPDRLTFPNGERRNGTLHLRVAPVAALELQHDAPRLIERINSYFGYAAVAELRLVQTPLKYRKTAPPPHPQKSPDGVQLTRLAACLEAVEDPEMRLTLNRLGIAILSESGKSTKN